MSACWDCPSPPRILQSLFGPAMIIGHGSEAAPEEAACRQTKREMDGMPKAGSALAEETPFSDGWSIPR